MNKSIWAKIRSVAGETFGGFITGTQVPNDKYALDVAVKESISIGSTPSGLTIGGKITEVTLNTSTWVALPTTPQTDRNAMGFQNLSNDVVSINFATPAGTIGWKVQANGELFFDVTDSIIVYAKAMTGSPTVTVMEIS